MFSRRGNDINFRSDQQKPRPERLPRVAVKHTCTNSCHRPVNGLHSIENRQVAGVDF
jgi:hypothetical protein